MKVCSVAPMRSVFPEAVENIFGNLDQVHPTGDFDAVLRRQFVDAFDVV